VIIQYCKKASPSITFAALSFVLVLGSVGVSAAPLQPMTVEIYNSSCQPKCQPNELPYNIYPVLSTGTADVDEYMQAALGIPASERPNRPYPRSSQFRIYMTPTGDGIPPGGFVRLTVPVYSQYAATVVPTEPNQYADWWGGGRIEIFEQENSLHSPPPELTANIDKTDSDRKDQQEVTFVSGTPLPTLSICTKEGVCKAQTLKFYIDPAGLASHEPVQTNEYTLGALIKNTDPWSINDKNVDYDISYVNDAFLPVAIEPHNNPPVGYAGSTTSIGAFTTSLKNFLKAYDGWPQFIDSGIENRPTITKLPSPVTLMPYYTAPNPPTDVTGTTGWPTDNWKPIKKIRDQWIKCTDKGGTDDVCPDITTVAKLFTANYVACYGSGTPTQDQMIAQVYQFSPFNVACTVHPGGGDSLKYHLLQNTPGYYKSEPGEKCDIPTGNNCDYSGYQAVKDKFDALQYWPGHPNPPDGKFDPWVVLVHGKDYLNSTSYAYSVDDAVGNIQVDGDGLIIVVGGAFGLPNPDPIAAPIQVAIGGADSDKVGVEPRFTEDKWTGGGSVGQEEGRRARFYRAPSLRPERSDFLGDA
jgi:hypothetical protein